MKLSFGKENRFERGEGHVLGMPGLVEPLETGCCAQVLQRSVYRLWRRVTVVSPPPLQEMGCRSNGCYGLDVEIAVLDSLDRAMHEIKLDDPFWP